MKRKLMIWGILGAMLVSLIGMTGCTPGTTTGTGGTTTTTTTTTTGNAEPVGFPEGDRWQPEEFTISTLVGIPSGCIETQNDRAVKYHKEANFNLIELCNMSDDEKIMAMDACRKYGVSVLPADGMFTDPEKSEAEIRARMDFYAPYADIIDGFLIMDEPKYDTELYQLLKERADLVRSLAPTKLMFFNLFPSYGQWTWASESGDPDDSDFANYCNDFFETVEPDVLSVDHYVFFNSEACLADLNINNLWRDWGFFRKRAIETGKPFWCYIQSLGIFMNDKGIGGMTPEKISFQLFGAIAYGAKGVSYYNSLASVIDMRAYKTELFDGVKEANRQALLFGNYLLDKEYDKLYHTSMMEKVEMFYYTDKLSESDLFASLPDNALVSTFKDDTDRKYVMIVNRSYENPLSGDMVLKGAKAVAMMDTADGSEKSVGTTDRISVSLPAGGAALYMIG